MVILAASICTKAGKALVSRQFVEMSRSRIEGLLASFPKLLVPGQQHTTVETDTLRYLYQPLGDDMYVVLITTRQYNIVLGINTLNLIVRAISDICDHSQEDIILHGFDIIMALDEIRLANLSKLRTIMAMESHEEQIQEIIERNKEQNAKQELKRQAKMFDQQRRDAANRSGGSLLSGGHIPSGPMISGGSMSSNRRISSSYEPLLASEPIPQKTGPRGMQLGRKGIPLPAEIPAEIPSQGISQSQSINQNQSQTQSLNLTSDVHLQIEEHITAIVNRDGGLEQMEVKGDLSLITKIPSIRVAVATANPREIKTHPKVDKKQFQANSMVMLKGNNSFPLSQPVGVLKWRIVSTDEDDVPLSINCWPSPADNGTISVNMEYELTNDKLELETVVVTIPVRVQPTISDIDGTYNWTFNKLEWQIPAIDVSNRSGSLDFSVPGDDPGAFFPVMVSFTCKQTLFDIEVTNVTTADDEEVEFSQSVALIPDQYAII
ncbi:coatomer subunit delta [Coemansia brasiliensis]|uniref:Coatomer subunit delta n=1 Tax=Coemansia brasiliensis TaxID=2650707 RepID=A0A9W8M213_9FUNG|nr:coatomer subunit delta [Coemansia brasiliensis]